MEKETRLSSEIVYHGKIFDIARDAVLLPSGRQSVREVLRHPGACAVLPVTQNGQLLFVRQFRYALQDFFLEIPAGKIDVGETPLACIKREMAEEIGKGAAVYTPMGVIASSPGCMDERIHLFLATDLYGNKLPADLDENLSVVSLTLQEAFALIDSGALTDAKTIIALFKYQQLLARTGGSLQP